MAGLATDGSGRVRPVSSEPYGTLQPHHYQLPDGRIFLKQEEECLAACTGAPMMMVDHVFHEHLTPESLDQILDGLK